MAARPASPQPPVGFRDLPSEIVQQIHLYALNPFFSQVSRLTYDLLHHSPSTFIATYLLILYAPYTPNDLLVRALRHPVCTLDVAREIKRLWDLRRGCRPTTSPKPGEPKTPPATPRHSAPALRCPELPRRLFRLAPSDQPIHPLIEYLFDSFAPSANSHKGYPLCRAVLTSNHVLAKFLLKHGADPSIKNSLAVEIAISKRDLVMIRSLIERDTATEWDGLDGSCSPEMGGGGRVKRRHKRAKLMDRIIISSRLVELAMTKGSKEIVRYFVHEKGVIPPLSSIMRLGGKGDLKLSCNKRGKGLFSF